MSRRRPLLGLVVVVLLLLAGCTDQGSGATGTTSRASAEQEQIARAAADLPSRPSGVVDIDGRTRGSLTADEAARYEATGTSTAVNVADNGEDQAFRQLCAGRIDLVDSARPMSRAEWDACRSVGLDVVQFQIAAEAVVVAIKAESDVGGDCLTVDQVRDIFRAGSPVVSWSNLGLDDVPLRVGGPNQDNNAFSFFGTYVLDAVQPSLTNLRSDYAAFENDQGARRFVVGSRRDERVANRYVDVSRRRGQVQQILVGARNELAAARGELAVARAERAKGIRDGRSQADQAKDIARVDSALAAWHAALVRVQRVRHTYDRISSDFRRVRDARKLVAEHLGRVSYFRFSYYELFEEQLRPFEITQTDGQRNCIFPSQATITSGEYPLARQLLITTTTRSLARGEVSDFLDHYLSRAQDAAVAARLVPLPDETVVVQRSWLTGDSAPPLVSPDDASAPSSSASARPAR